MVEIPSPSYHEQALAAELVTAMGELGFDARTDAAGNVIGEIRRGAGPTVMLIGHLDTVPGTLAVGSACGRLYGRGTVDAKGPLAAMVCAAAAASGFTGRLVVVGAVEEETPGSRGAVAIREAHEPPDAVIVGEPSGWSTVVLGYKGKLDLRYEVRCPPTHPSNPAPKASELATGCWAHLVELLGPQAGHATFDRPGATITSISGDLTSALIELSVRIPPGYDTGGLVARLRERVPAGDLLVVNSVPACRVDRRDPVVRALFAGIRRCNGRPRAKVKTATSDMNTLAEAWRVPMATYGPGDSRLDHGNDEHIVLADYLRAIDVLCAALTELGTNGAIGPVA